MTRFGKLIGTAALTLAFGAGAAIAQTPQAQTPVPQARAPGAASTTQTAPQRGNVKLKTPTTAAGKECSTQADAKGLHGAERKKFRATCKREMKAKSKA